jgi:hypothetical protein
MFSQGKWIVEAEALPYLTALMKASCISDVEEIRRCVTFDKNVNVRELLADSEASGHPERSLRINMTREGHQIAFIEETGAKLKSVGFTALMLACLFKQPVAVKELLFALANVEHTDNYGRTAVCYAAMSGDVECMKLLLDQGAHPDGGPKHLSLYYSITNRRVDATRMLLDHGADRKITVDGMDLAKMAKNYGGEDVIALLEMKLGVKVQ